MFGRVVRGVVADVVPASNVYLVRVPLSVAAVHCVALTPAAYVFGARTFGFYPPGTPVICVLFNTDGTPGFGIIIGGISPMLSNIKYAVSDWISPFAGTNAFTDAVDSFIQTQAGDSIESFAAGQPLDAIPGHDMGVMQDLGTGYGVGLLEAWLRASDIAGIWCYYQDNLVRLATYNFDHWHAGGERWIRNDQGEVNDVDSLTPYPWEALGVWEPGAQVYRKEKDGGVYKRDATLPYVPLKPDQTGIFRHRISRGYAADLYRHEVILPKLEDDSQARGEQAALSDEERHNFSGLLAVTEHSDGLFSVRSAKGLVFEKYLFIPVARQTAVPEQNTESGDSAPANYAPSGYEGPNIRWHRRNIVKLPEEEDRPDTWIGQLFDIHAYVFNWWSQKRTLAHQKDWALPEEGYFAHKEDNAQAKDWFGSVYIPDPKGFASPLVNNYVLDAPGFFDIQVDHNTKSRYYCSRSVISQLPDGSIVIEDGYGSGLYFSQGNVRLTCAGDFLVQPGRSFVSIAGDDTVLRTGSSVDISAALGDVRLKAERNLHMLAGNGEIGGVLIEARSKAISRPTAWLKDKVGEDALTAGIMFKTDHGGPLVFRGSDMRFVAEGADGNQGLMTVEATGGGIHMEADFITRKAAGGLGFADYGANGRLLCATTSELHFRHSGEVLYTVDRMGVGGSIYAGGAIYAADGVIPADNSNDVLSGLYEKTGAWGQDIVGSQELQTYIAAAKERTEWLLDAGFSFRTPEQYGTDAEGFYLVEARWQRMYRERKTGLGFIEPAVTAYGVGEDNDVHTLPYPGFSAWREDEKYKLVNSKLFDWTNRRAKPRSLETYDAGQMAELKDAVLHNNYLISKQLDL